MHFSYRLPCAVAFIFAAATTVLPLAAHASAATLIPDNAIGAHADSSNETEVMSTYEKNATVTFSNVITAFKIKRS